jgi:hypothetical protein
LRISLVKLFAQRALPFQEIKNCLDCGLKFSLNAMTDPHLITLKEKVIPTSKLRDIDLILEKIVGHENLIPFPNTVRRLKDAGTNEFFFVRIRCSR